MLIDIIVDATGQPRTEHIKEKLLTRLYANQTQPTLQLYSTAPARATIIAANAATLADIAPQKFIWINFSSFNKVCTL